ncbi:MAG: hypothetical protein U0271_41525 [Polyangiaceae bacterium]
MVRRIFGSLVFCLVAATPVIFQGCAEETIDPVSPTKIDIDRPEGCNPLGATDACLFPYPSGFHEVDDPTSATGVRLSLRQELMPHGGGPVLDVSPYNQADGVSPVNPILVHFGATIDTSGLPSIHEPQGSLDEDATVSLVDLESGKRVLSFVEMDVNSKPDFPDHEVFIVRPIEPMEMGHRHAVFIRKGLKDVGGTDIAPTDAFEALRDDVATTNDDVEAIRPRMKALFSRGEELGFERSTLLLAFDFQVASKDWLLGPVLAMRDEALSATAAGELGYTIDEVQENPNEDIAKIVLGSFEVPTYLDESDAFVVDDAGIPQRQATNRSYPFTLLVPKRAETDGPLPLVVLGHGIFGNGRDFLTGDGDGRAIQALSQAFGAIVIATDWIGLSSNDLPRIAGEVAPNLNRITIITDQLQQALVNAIVLTKLGLGPLKDDSQVVVAANSIVDTSRVYYWGASLGGIEGSSFISLSPDIPRAVFGVPGSSWSTMLTRSIVFPPVKAFIELNYPDPLDLAFLMTVAQLRFDHSDPANVTRLMFKEPLPDAPANRVVLLQEAIGDSQVPNLATDILVRAMGVKLLGPAFYEPFGVPVIQAPTTESAVIQYRLEEWDDPAPPDTDTPPSAENGVHHAMNFLPNAQAQIGALLLDGQIISVCSDTCDPN